MASNWTNELKGENWKYQDKYSNLAIPHLIENISLWSCGWICGLDEGKALNKVGVNVNGPSEKSHYRGILTYGDCLLLKGGDYMFQQEMIRSSLGVSALCVYIAQVWVHVCGMNMFMCVI